MRRCTLAAISLIVMVPGCVADPHSPPATAPATRPAELAWPKTVEEAVGRLLIELSDKDKAAIKAMEEKDLIELHMSLGMWIRNNFGLWGGNDALMNATGKRHPDDASGVILKALWERLRAGSSHPAT